MATKVVQISSSCKHPRNDHCLPINLVHGRWKQYELYAGAPHRLEGCISDAECIQYLLTSRLGFAQHDITVLRDDNPSMMPTRANMLHHMQMLTGQAQPGDSLFFHFSGGDPPLHPPTPPPPPPPPQGMDGNCLTSGNHAADDRANRIRRLPVF